MPPQIILHLDTVRSGSYKRTLLIVEQRETNLMSLAFLVPYLLLNMFRMLIDPSSGPCDLFVELFHGLYCSGTMCVGVTLWFGWGGVVWCIRMQAEAWYDACWCYVVVWPQRNTNTHRTRAIQPMK